jgi:hypothetical protein
LVSRAVVDPFQDVVDEQRSGLVDQLLGMLHDDCQLDARLLDYPVEFSEVDVALDDQVLGEAATEAGTDFFKQLVDECGVGLPDPAVEPDDVPVVLLIVEEPVHHGRLATVSRPHEYEALLLQFFFHSLDLRVDGHNDLRLQIGLTHHLHHDLHQIVRLLLRTLAPRLRMVLEFAETTLG